MRMRSRRVAVTVAMLAVVLAGSAGPACAQREQDHEELRRMARAIKEAVNAGRLDQLTPLLAKDFSITMVDQSVITEPGQLQEYYRRYFEAPGAILGSVRIEPAADVLTHFLDDVTGVNRGSSIDTYTLKSGRQVVFRTRWTGTFRKYDGQWKVVSLHAGTSFLDNPLLGAAEAARYAWAAGGLAVGLVVGGGVGWWRGRRRPRA